ncbi:SRPBCC family protein [Algoriphagus yeomjeoni]|uniref:SRPBCC family protein n=1 Tax=Algoriphagus yeomjeoni TaxID=291403 RepID=UPI003CE462B4
MGNSSVKSFSIFHTLTIKASEDKVFDAVSDPRHLVNWWPQRCTGSPKLGSIYNFYFSEEYDWFGKVVSVDPKKSFHIKMTESDQDWNPTTFGFELEESGEKVVVKFSHTNWPACNEHFKIASYCWAILLQGLKSYIEKGIIVPFEERE